MRKRNIAFGLGSAVCFVSIGLGTALPAQPGSVDPASSTNVTECKGPAGKAVVELPSPLSEWGEIDCSLYGPVITAHQGWVWQNPGAYSPVVIPAQLRRQPTTGGGPYYFTKIDFRKVDSQEFRVPFAVFHSIFQDDPPPDNGYRLDVESSMGRSMKLYFLESGYNRWGVWCPDGKCDPKSWFIILDMKHRPGEKPPEDGR